MNATNPPTRPICDAPRAKQAGLPLEVPHLLHRSVTVSSSDSESSSSDSESSLSHRSDTSFTSIEGSPQRLMSQRESLAHHPVLTPVVTAAQIPAQIPALAPPASEPIASPRISSQNHLSLNYKTSTTKPQKFNLGDLHRQTQSKLHPSSPASSNPPTHPQVLDDETIFRNSILAKREEKKRRLLEEDGDRVLVGNKITEDHVNYVTAYNMLTGIRVSVSRCNAQVDRPLTDADFKEKHKVAFDVSGNEILPSAKYDFKFKDYSPWVFRHLRDIFHVDQADYLMSLTSKYILSELGSPGKSGSFFYFSRDYRFIIKTIHHAEHKRLRKILKDYYNHAKENPNTLISQFYGLHRVKMPFGRKIHFVVMNNLFPPHRDIHKRYDLKGSTMGRFTDVQGKSGPVLKDLNWLNSNEQLKLGPEKSNAFVSQLEKDVVLLKKLGIMDYSLLLGVHELERGNKEKIRDRTLSIFEPNASEVNQIKRTSTDTSTAEKRCSSDLRNALINTKPITARLSENLPETVPPG